MAKRKHGSNPRMRSTHGGSGFKYFSGALRDMAEQLTKENAAIFKAACFGFRDHGRGAVRRIAPGEYLFVPKELLLTECGSDGTVLKHLNKYPVMGAALVCVSTSDYDVLYLLRVVDAGEAVEACTVWKQRRATETAAMTAVQ